MTDRQSVKIISPSFADGGEIPIQHTGFGEDRSPAFHIQSLCEEAVSMAIIMDDLDVPFIKPYNHWIIWNIPAMEAVPEGVPEGSVVHSLGDAIQGIGYGRNRYRGPKPPFFVRTAHHYEFHFFILDTFLQLEKTAKRKELLAAMQGHILQRGKLSGFCRR